MRCEVPSSFSLCPFSSSIFLPFQSQNHHSLLPLLEDTTETVSYLSSLESRMCVLVNMPFFLVFLSLSLSPDVWNMDAAPADDFFFDLVDFASSSLSSLSDLAAACETNVDNEDYFQQGCMGVVFATKEVKQPSKWQIIKF